jgi:threonyl-tRNA synthetase
MPVVTLPDGSQRKFAQPVTVAEVAQSIGAGLARAALAGKVDGRLVDTSFCIATTPSWASSPTRIPKGSKSSGTRWRT